MHIMPFLPPGQTSVFPAERLDVAMLEFNLSAMLYFSSFYSYIHKTHENRHKVESRHNLPR